jgi:non-ribosomal peptide synthetase component F
MRPTPVHELICGQAGRTPDAVAVRDADTVLTYRELLDAASLIAGRLVGEGIGPGSVVGLCAVRSVRLVEAVLGILLAGTAYLPVDPAQPAPRLPSMLASARVDLLLADKVPDGCLAPVRPLDGGPATARPVPWLGHVAATEVADGVAAVIFTSGSTGVPKGAEVTHVGLAARLPGMLAEHDLGADDVLLQKTPFTFDVSMWELLLALMAGGILVVAPSDAHRDPRALMELIIEHRVTLAHFVPSMLALFATEPDVGRCTSLRTVLCGVRPCRRSWRMR